MIYNDIMGHYLKSGHESSVSANCKTDVKDNSEITATVSCTVPTSNGNSHLSASLKVGTDSFVVSQTGDDKFRVSDKRQTSVAARADLTISRGCCATDTLPLNVRQSKRKSSKKRDNTAVRHPMVTSDSSTDRMQTTHDDVKTLLRNVLMSSQNRHTGGNSNF